MFIDLAEVTQYLAMLGTTLIDLDEDKEEADDIAGSLALYASEVIDSIIMEEELPELPELIAKGVDKKITGTSRAVIILVRNALALARFQVKGTARKALNYVFEALGLLLEKKPIPAFVGSRKFEPAKPGKPKG